MVASLIAMMNWLLARLNMLLPLRAYSHYLRQRANNLLAHVRDLLVAPQIAGALRVLLHLLVQQARRQTWARLSFECFGNEVLHRTLRAGGLFERGETPLVAVWRPDASTAELEWYLTAADTEL